MIMEESSLFDLSLQSSNCYSNSSNESTVYSDNKEAKKDSLSAYNKPFSTGLIVGDDSKDLKETESDQSNEEYDQDSMDESADYKITPSLDHRVLAINPKILPYSAQGRIEIISNGVKTWGSGTLISSKHVLTAASHLYSHQSSQEADKIIFIPAFRSREWPNGYIRVKKFFYPEEYRSVKYEDYGLLELEYDIGHITGLLDIKIHTADEIDNKECSIYGYPTRIKGVWNTDQYGMDTRVFKCQDRDLLRYQIYSTLGHIGSSIYYHSPEENKYFTIGLHARGSNGIGYNIGTLLTTRRVARIQNWRDDIVLPTRHNLSSLEMKVYGINAYLGRIRDCTKDIRDIGVISLYGAAGVGKSTIALKYAIEAIGSYDYIWWIDRERLESSLTALSDLLNIHAASYEEMQDRLRDYINHSTCRFLFIFDDLEDEEIIFSFLPDRGHFIITTRLLIAEFNQIEVSSLSCDASVELLSTRLSYFSDEDLVSLANFLEGLPLALTQAALDIIEYRMEVSQYIQEFYQIMTRNEKLKNIVRSNIESLRKESKHIMKIVCLGDCNNIPYKMLEDIYRYKYPDFNIAFKEIIGYNLLRYDTQTGVCKIYRVIHQASILQLSSLINDEVIQYYSNYLFDYYNPDKVVQEGLIKILTLHTTTFLAKYENTIQPSRAVLLYSRVAIAYARYFKDRKASYEYIQITEALLSGQNGEDLDLASVYNNLGELYYNMEGYSRSAEYYSKCLSIRETTLSEHHPDIAKLYDKLGGVYYYMKDYTRSEEHYSKSLKIMQDTNDIARIYDSLGGLNCRLGNYKRSEKYYLKCLNITDTQNHQAISEVYMKLGALYSTMRDYPRSEKSYSQSLSIMETILPLNSPKLAYIRSCLEGVSRAMESII